MVLTPAQRSAIDALARDLDRVFGARLESLVAYPGLHADGTLHSLALIDHVAFNDLAACLPLAGTWHRRGLAVPLMLSRGELHRTLDIFPLEYAAIIASHVVVRGRDPFEGLAVPAADLRRACEAQAKSHLIHLREAFLESHGESSAIASLIAASAAPFRALLSNIARLTEETPASEQVLPSDESLARLAEARMGIPSALVRDVFGSAVTGQATIADPSALLARYLDAARAAWQYVDAWRSSNAQA